MSRLYDPIAQTVFEKEDFPEPSSLQDLCRKSIIQAVTLGDIDKVHQLPLPTSIKTKVGALSMRDFAIDVEKLSPENHIKRCYPATCCLTNDEVIIKVFPRNSNFHLSDYDPSMVASFKENGHLCCVLIPTQSLAEKIDKAKECGTTLEHGLIWKTLTKVLHIFLSGQISPVTSIPSTDIRYLPNGWITINPPDNEASGMVTAMEAQIDKPVYEAPEVLGRQNPDSKAHSWNLGCLLYEMLALEPAFYDRSGVNPFSVFMDIMQGNLPAVPATASQSLTDLVNRCLVSDSANRLSLREIEDAIIQHNSTNL